MSILRQLPDAPLAMLEGLNGIGKTLAIRLLLLCTGDMPYLRTSPAWASFSRGLGPFIVTVTGLRGVNEIRWVGDSREWDTGPDLNGTPASFREIAIDGRPVTIDEVRQHFIVSRLGGEEGLIETFANRSDRLSDVVERWQRRYADQQEGPLVLLEDAVEASEGLLGNWSRDRVVSLSTKVDVARKAVESAEHQTDEAKKQYDSCALAAKLSQQLREMRERAPDLREQANKNDSETAEIQQTIKRLQTEVLALSGQAAAARPLLKELTNARRAVQRHRKELTQQSELAAILASRLGVSTESGVIRERISEIQRDLARLQDQMIKLDAAPSVRTLLDQTIPLFSEAGERGLGDQVVMEDTEIPLELSVIEVRKGLQNRWDSLEGQLPPPDAYEIDEQMQQAAQLISQARRILSTLQHSARSQRLLATNEDRVEKALAKINPDAIDQMHELERLRSVAEERLVVVTVEKAVLAQQLETMGGGTTEEQLGSQLRSMLEQLSLSEDQIEPAVSESEASLQHVRASLIQAQQLYSEADREFAHAGGEIQRASEALNTDPRLAWLGYHGSSSGAGYPDLVEQAVIIGLMCEKVEVVKNRLGNVRGQLGALFGALHSISGQLRGHEGPSSFLYVKELRQWLSQHFSEFFNTPNFRQELFPLAQGDISVDLTSGDVSWLENDAVQRRPLEAFSSGEQAFAYTRARLGALDEQGVQVENRLIVLDEFGAFIAHDRLTELLFYLKRRAQSHPGDQVLVMLPLSQDYEQLAKGAIGGQAEMFRRLAQEVAENKYAVQVLVQ